MEVTAKIYTPIRDAQIFYPARYFILVYFICAGSEPRPDTRWPQLTILLDMG